MFGAGPCSNLWLNELFYEVNEPLYGQGENMSNTVNESDFRH